MFCSVCGSFIRSSAIRNICLDCELRMSPTICTICGRSWYGNSLCVCACRDGGDKDGFIYLQL